MIWPFKKKKKAISSEESNPEYIGDGNQSSLRPEDKEAGLESVTVDFEQERKKVDFNSRESRIAYITYLRDTIYTAKKECEDVKFEYGQVTSYLKDIQLIDGALPEDKKILLDIAEGIYELNKERNRLQKQKYQITDIQKHAMEELESLVEKDTKVLKEEEAFLLKVKSDLGQLSVEKKSLIRERKEIVVKQRVLKTLAKSMIGIFASLSVLLYVVGMFYHTDVTTPFIGMIAFCLLICAYIMYEVYKNRRDIMIAEKRCERAVFLINRIKIKYVNSIKLIDYICSKYGVRNGMELEFVHGQYRKMKRELVKQYESTKLLDEYHRILLHELKKIGVKDKELWFFQAEALVNPKEMVEVRHRLNLRRQKLRNRIEYNSDVMERCVHELDLIQQINPNYEKEIHEI